VRLTTTAPSPEGGPKAAWFDPGTGAGITGRFQSSRLMPAVATGR